MSGDVQPRKRKDKRRKKDDLNEEILTPTKHPTDEVIHIHKESSLGGNVCTKIIFFCLLGTLGVMISFTIFEYRGTSDEDHQSAVDSPWAVMFQDWADYVPDLIHALTSQEEEEPEEDGEHESEEQGDETEEPEINREVQQESDEEEMFPEAIEALRREQEELGQKEEVEEELEEPEIEPEETITNEEVNEDEETSGAENVESGEAVEESAPVAQQAPTTLSPEPKLQRSEEPIKETPPPLKIPVPESIPIRNEPQEEEIEYEEEEEEEEEDEEVEDMGQGKVNEITAKKYEQLLAQYGQVTPDSSDVEQSDDDALQREYSDGAEEESVGEEESGNENADVSEPEEQQQHWTSVKRSEVQLESDDEEEESEDEAPPVASRRPAGGPKTSEQAYENEDITNEFDWEIKDDLDHADEDLKNNRTHVALNKYTSILEKHPDSPRARYGKAKCLDEEAESKKSNAILNKAIEAYLHALSAPHIPDSLFLKLASRAIDRMQFRGLHMKAIPVYNMLIQRFNNTPNHMNGLAINYLMMNRLEEGGELFKKVLEKWPSDAIAQVHYGLVLKLQGKNKESIPYLQSGLAVDIPGTRDARLYFHLGDALSRLGYASEAMKVYEQAVGKGLFRSKYQRSLYNVDRLTGRPWWTIEQTTYKEFFRKLEANWKVIRDEGVAAMKIVGAFKDEAEKLRDIGDWKQFELFARGMRYTENCRKTPVTCSIIDEFEPARSCRRGQSKFSVMEAGTHVWPHCGPTNCRLRAHLGLVIPPGTSLRVADATETWKEGKVIVFDDSFEHEVWHNGTSLRLVLIVDVWHPELTKQERISLSPI